MRENRKRGREREVKSIRNINGEIERKDRDGRDKREERQKVIEVETRKEIVKQRRDRDKEREESQSWKERECGVAIGDREDLCTEMEKQREVKKPREVEKQGGGETE